MNSPLAAGQLAEVPKPFYEVADLEAGLWNNIDSNSSSIYWIILLLASTYCSLKNTSLFYFLMITTIIIINDIY